MRFTAAAELWFNENPFRQAATVTTVTTVTSPLCYALILLAVSNLKGRDL
ncbi:MAG TPA: hypothetical protein GXX29_12290 [Firmicutes bacterium]|nr:hypothetical protein [Bacillota bacterium]